MALMRVLIAHNARGFLHAVTCDHPAGFGAQFRATMAAQACTVQDLSMEEYSQLRALAYVPSAKGQAAAAPAPEEAQPEDTTAPLALPEVGQEVRTAVFARATVVAVLTWPDGTQAALVRAPGGEGLARPDEWSPAAPEPARAVPPPPAQARASPPPPEPAPPAPLPTRMPNLFGDWS